ncbi:hypothetical protein [Pseudomonas sp.]|uniref:hypothetical protein n=1 Tax=Pseudomonas sp. TaxID=306 RepID=UPI00289F1214|nr:hypothetical protein [Pseudomonas sp.]
MPKWKITYSNSDGNTSVVETQSEQKPEMEQAAALISDQALERVDKSEIPRDHESPMVALLERHGITITGIAEAE